MPQIDMSSSSQLWSCGLRWRVSQNHTAVDRSRDLSSLLFIVVVVMWWWCWVTATSPDKQKQKAKPRTTRFQNIEKNEKKAYPTIDPVVVFWWCVTTCSWLLLCHARTKRFSLKRSLLFSCLFTFLVPHQNTHNKNKRKTKLKTPNDKISTCLLIKKIIIKIKHNVH